MLQLDDVQLYDLSEAGGLLFKDPARLTREALLRKLPSTRVEEGLALPTAWVEAEAGVSDADPIALCGYWLARLAPPSPSARRPRRAVETLGAADLLEPEEAARRLCATPAALQRLDLEGTVPSLRVEDALRYDAALVDLVARAEDGEDDHLAVEARRTQVRAWARFEYGAVEAPPPLPTYRAQTPAVPTAPAFPKQAPPVEDPDAPKAFEIPEDLGLDAIDLPEEDADRKPSSDLMEIDGFETVDE